MSSFFKDFIDYSAQIVVTLYYSYQLFSKIPKSKKKNKATKISALPVVIAGLLLIFLIIRLIILYANTETVTKAFVFDVAFRMSIITVTTVMYAFIVGAFISLKRKLPTDLSKNV